MTIHLTCPKFVTKLRTDKDGIIIYAYPIGKAFIGEPLENLFSYARKFGKIEYRFEKSITK